MTQEEVQNLEVAIQQGDESMEHPDKAFEVLLGSKEALIDFAAFYEKYKNKLAVLKEYYLREFNDGRIFSKEEHLAFKMGLENSFEFLKKCYEEKNQVSQGESDLTDRV